MIRRIIVTAASLLLAGGTLSLAQLPQEPSDQPDAVLQADALFWQAYNGCDVGKMGTFFTEDVEFYHDKHGLTTGRPGLMESFAKGLCADDTHRTRRELVEGSLKLYPLTNYGAILSGEHFFYINEPGKKEQRVGIARFTNVWQNKSGDWKMSRVLSYDHQPAPYQNTRIGVPLPAFEAHTHKMQCCAFTHR